MKKKKQKKELSQKKEKELAPIPVGVHFRGWVISRATALQIIEAAEAYGDFMIYGELDRLGRPMIVIKNKGM